MREILFRGKSMGGEWVYGDLHLLSAYPHIHTVLTSETHKIDRETIGQYTGLTDINGVKIYEGDILKCLGSGGDVYLSVVRYDEGAFTIDVHYCDYDHTVIGWAFNEDLDDVEIIGNIHDNQELIK